MGDKQSLALHPGSGGRRKNWPPSAFAAVADLLAEDYAVLVIGGPADEEALAATMAACGSKPACVRDLSLGRLAALLTRCAAYLGNDSGVSHLAALLGVPTVALFGPTDPALWRPFGSRVAVLRWGGDVDELAAAQVAAAVRSAAGRWQTRG